LQQTWDQQQNSKQELASRKKRTRNKAIVTRKPHVTCDDHWASQKPSCLAEPVTPSLVTTEQAQAMTSKTTIFLVIQE
jgi:hypothetical protein